MTTPAAADFAALAAQYKPPELRAYYLGVKYTGFVWGNQRNSSRRRPLVANLYLRVGLSDAQIAHLMEKTQGKVRSYRLNNQIRHSRRSNYFERSKIRDDDYPPLGWKERWGGPLGPWVEKPIE